MPTQRRNTRSFWIFLILLLAAAGWAINASQTLDNECGFGYVEVWTWIPGGFECRPIER
ncbi:MAG: hypothetical protein MUF83_08765 [Acidimicrobiales bacterium]|jgi:hypothetical protein|nr:hypothetical protein [Acidimicrobiales bacterium]